MDNSRPIRRTVTVSCYFVSLFLVILTFVLVYFFIQREPKRDGKVNVAPKLLNGLQVINSSVASADPELYDAKEYKGSSSVIDIFGMDDAEYGLGGPASKDIQSKFKVAISKYPKAESEKEIKGTDLQSLGRSDISSFRYGLRGSICVDQVACGGVKVKGNILATKVCSISDHECINNEGKSQCVSNSIKCTEIKGKSPCAIDEFECIINKVNLCIKKTKSTCESLGMKQVPPKGHPDPGTRGFNVDDEGIQDSHEEDCQRETVSIADGEKPRVIKPLETREFGLDLTGKAIGEYYKKRGIKVKSKGLLKDLLKEDKLLNQDLKEPGPLKTSDLITPSDKLPPQIAIPIVASEPHVASWKPPSLKPQSQVSTITKDENHTRLDTLTRVDTKPNLKLPSKEISGPLSQGICGPQEIQCIDASTSTRRCIPSNNSCPDGQIVPPKIIIVAPEPLPKLKTSEDGDAIDLDTSTIIRDHDGEDEGDADYSVDMTDDLFG
ncbi:hypothetical protein BdWA1_001524 [Babesia duncani]|uniref:Uncharacterized protein n=1 Tax=Babesia duncani TaxID=323732 RepID=A0AAD9PK12_9APIC|nr:hypothetical protein BdWA1_001524 [Babesia duncani]